uniref:GRF-type domain-containing protein n=1 Tax=Oryza glumipatula TaxID=40148 RepID=A0A0D9YAQ7_9ORYZ
MVMASSMSDSSSSSSRQKKASPVPYRVGPLEYQSVVMCRCRPPAKAARWISWSVDNPGRRYYKCQKARVRGCDFWVWCDEPTSNFIKELLNDLRDVVTSLRRKNEWLKEVVAQSRAHGEQQRKKVEDVRNVVAVKNEEIRRLKAMNQKLVIGVLSCVVVLLVLLFGKN